MKGTRLFLLSLMIALYAFGQQPSSPKTIREVCESLEASIVKARRDFDALLDPRRSTEPDESNALFSALSAKIEQDELSWNRLGCVHILYPPGNDRP